jgi:hypothetical protein
MLARESQQMNRRANDTLKIVGFDPSMRNWGIAYGTFDVLTKDVIITSLDIAKTTKSKDKTIRTNSSDLDRAETLAESALAAVQGAQAVFVEVPVGSRSAVAAKSYGMCIGILGALRANGISFFLVTPDEVKAVSGIKNASKKEMIEWAMKKYPDINWPMQTELGVTSVVVSTAEHMADAVAAIHAGINSQPFKQLITLLNPV